MVAGRPICRPATTVDGRRAHDRPKWAQGVRSGALGPLPVITPRVGRWPPRRPPGRRAPRRGRSRTGRNDHGVRDTRWARPPTNDSLVHYGQGVSTVYDLVL